MYVADQLLTETVGHVRILTLNRPQARNALGDGLIEMLYDALLDADDDGRVSAIVLTGTDPAFCAGVDLKEAARDGRAYFDRYIDKNCVAQVAAVRTPIVGAINGATFTGGLEIALGCDFLIASERAIFADTHVRVGVLPGGGLTARLPRVVGAARARRMSMTGEIVDAQQALRIGLVTEVAPHAELMPRALQLATSIAEVDPRMMTGLKRLYAEGGAAQVEPALAAEARIGAETPPDFGGIDQRSSDVVSRNRAQLSDSD
jgi:enoyl-CoA hydratase/carnithine racemase